MADLGIGAWPLRRARIDADAVALRQDERSLTYGQLAQRVERLAQALRAAGVGPGDRVAYLGLNDLATFEAMFATNRLGAIFVPMNWRLAPAELRYLVDDGAPRLLFHGPEFAAVAQQLPVRSIALGEAYEAFLAGGSAEPIDSDVALEDDAVILYTSGTTGHPKGAVLTHANLTFNVVNQFAHVDVLTRDVALCMCPLFHASGLGQVSLPTLLKGGTVVVVARFEAGVVLQTLARYHVASFSAVPTMLQLLADHPDFAGTDLSSLRYGIYGGSAVLERAAVAWHARGVELLQGYGMTEAAPGVTMARGNGAAERPTSIGVPHFFTDISFAPGGAPAAPGESGELFVSGPNVFRGYWNRPADTAAALEDGWYRTGDVVRIADDGWAYVADRIKDMIISGGENIYPSEVEAAMNALPGIVDAAVVAVPDERWGEVGAAFVMVAEPGAWTDTDLRAALAGRIASYKIPKYFSFVAELPRTAVGKVRKQELRTLYPAQDAPA